MFKLKLIGFICASLVLVACDKDDDGAVVDNSACSEEIVDDHNSAIFTCNMVDSGIGDIDQCIDEIQHIVDKYPNLNCKALNLETNQETWLSTSYYKDMIESLNELKKQRATDETEDYFNRNDEEPAEDEYSDSYFLTL